MSALPAAQSLEHVAPVLAPQILTSQDQGLEVYQSPYLAGTVAVAQREELLANHAPGPVGYPAALSCGDPGYFNLNAASVTVGWAQGNFGVTAPENSFMGNFYEFGLDTFDA